MGVVREARGDVQFGRYVEVEIKDFKNNVRKVIGNDFEIEFEYFKTIDQTKEDDSGRIVIYGLTPRTIKSLQSEGGEVVLRCGYLGSEIQPLFIASIIRLYYDTRDNTTVTTIECSANVMNFYLVDKIHIESKSGMSLFNWFSNLSDILTFNQVAWNIDSVPESDVDMVKEFLETASISLSLIGDANTILKDVCNMYGFSYMKEVYETGERIIRITVEDTSVQIIRRLTDEGYEKIGAEISGSVGTTYAGMYESHKDENVAAILNPLTGLISSKTEYKIAKAYIDQELGANEQETQESIEKRAAQAAKIDAKNKKEAAKEAKAKKEGKKYTPPKGVGKITTTLEVLREYCKVKALLNPRVLPQSTVLVYDKDYEGETPTEESEGDTEVKSQSTIDRTLESGFTAYIAYRVREAVYKGNNKNHDWTMELYCENTGRNSQVDEDIANFLRTVDPADLINEDTEIESVGFDEGDYGEGGL